MKILCELFIQRSVLVRDTCTRRKKSTIALSQDENNICYFTIFNNEYKSGFAYKLTANIDKIYDKCISLGKVTITFKIPNHSVFITCSNYQKLALFVKSIELVSENKQLRFSKRFLPTKATPIIGKKVTKLVIEKFDDLPKNGFPMSLQTLIIDNIDFNLFCKFITTLRNLTVLSLTNANITEIPIEFKLLSNLQICDLSSNKIHNYNWLNEPLRSKLISLNLSNNHLIAIPMNIFFMDEIQELNLSGNKIRKISRMIKSLCHLRILNIANNRLAYLPITLTELRLQNCDISGNPLRTTHLLNIEMKQPKVRKLKEIVALKILTLNVPYNKCDLPDTLRPYLRMAVPCRCGRVIIETSITIIVPVPKSEIVFQANAVVYDSEVDSIFIKHYFCSKTCFDPYCRAILQM